MNYKQIYDNIINYRLDNPFNGYTDWELVKKTELVSLSNSTISGGAGCISILAKLACDGDTDCCGTYFPDWYLRFHAYFRFLSEHTDFAWIDSRHRYCGGRCHCGGGECRTSYGDGEIEPV